MLDQMLAQILAVVVGGLLAIAGGFITPVLVDRQRQARESRNLALAFKGEITALLTLIKERRYLERFAEVTQQIEATQKPFYMPMRVRFRYDRVYESNVTRIGVLNGALPELLPLFYTRLTSMLEDISGLSEGTYASLELPTLLRIYRDLQSVLKESIILGERIVQEIDRQYR
jgi:hypothetical protein